MTKSNIQQLHDSIESWTFLGEVASEFFPVPHADPVSEYADFGDGVRLVRVRDRKTDRVYSIEFDQERLATSMMLLPSESEAI